MPSARGARQRGSSAPRWVAGLILVALLAGVGYYIYRQQPHRAGRVAPAAQADCGGALPDFQGQAVARAKSARFTTVEQLVRLTRPDPTTVYRLQARLLQTSAEGQQYRLLLASLVQRGLTLTARLPAGRCAANRDDGALLDELRQDINLQFGPLSGTVHAPPQATQVIVAGVAAVGPGGIELRPLLDFEVQ